MQWNSSYQESIFTFANNINTHEGGTHLSGFRSALTRTLNDYARKKGLLKEKDDNLAGEDVREGLTAIISVKLARPAVRGPDQDQARQPAGQGLRPVDRQPQAGRVPRGEPGRGAADHRQGRRGRTRTRGRAQGARPDAAQVGARELDAAGQARRLLGAGPGAGRDLHRRGRLGRRHGKQARDRNTQAVLPLRGKIINVEKNRIDKVLSNEEIQALITAIGTGIREEFDLEKPRYHKVILMTDADVDGAHIRTLVLTFLFREMQGLIEAGYVYIAKPPLYKMKSGSKEQYIEKESELEEVLLRDKLEKIEVFDRDGNAVQAHAARWQRYGRLLKEYEGWASLAARRVRPRRDHVPRGVADPRHRLTDADKVVELLRQKAPEGEPYDTEVLVRERRRSSSCRVIERKSGSAHTHRLRARDVRRHRVPAASCACTSELESSPARRRSSVELGERTERGAVVRGPAHEGAGRRQRGRAAQRFKGLGRDERRPAVRDDDGPGDAHAAAGDDRRRRRRPTSCSRC